MIIYLLIGAIVIAFFCIGFLLGIYYLRETRTPSSN